MISAHSTGAVLKSAERNSSLLALRCCKVYDHDETGSYKETDLLHGALVHVEQTPPESFHDFGQRCSRHELPRDLKAP